MLNKVILLLAFLNLVLFPQVLKEFEVKPTENRGQIPIFRDYPDKAAVIFYTKFANLMFSSSYGIHKQMGDPDGGKYIIVIEPTRQTIEVRCAGYKTEQIKIPDLQPRDVLYYEIMPKKEEGVQGVSEVGVTIQVTPSDATILVDGKPFPNKTTQKLGIGTHKLRVEKAGYSPYWQEIYVTPEKTFFMVTLTTNDPVAVTINSTPMDAEILLDGISKGKTKKSLYLYPGVYELRLVLSGYLSISEKISVNKDETKNVFQYNLSKNSGMLRINVTPRTARVRINKEFVNSSELQELAPGIYQIEAEAETYHSYKGTVQIKIGETRTENISLAQKAGKLQFTINPSEAECVLKQNGVEKYRWTGLNILKSIAEGTYDLTANAKGYKSFNKTVKIKENQTTVEDIQMTRGNDYPEVSSKNTVDFYPSYVTASSTLPPSFGLNYSPSNTIDNDLSTWWSPHNQYSRHWIQFNFNAPTKIHAMKILNGSHYSNFSYQGVNYGDLYSKNAVITSAILEFSNGKRVTVDLAIYDGMQTIEFPEVTTSFVKLIPISLAPGAEWPDICISEISFL